MMAKSNSLSKADIREILAHLESSIAVLEKRAGRLNASELSLKSMLGALRRELQTQLTMRDRLED